MTAKVNVKRRVYRICPECESRVYEDEPNVQLSDSHGKRGGIIRGAWYHEDCYEDYLEFEEMREPPDIDYIP